MSQIVTCPHCGKENHYTEPSLGEALKVPIASSVGSAAVYARSREAGLIVGGILLAINVIRYLDGVSMTCAYCRRQFHVRL
jgi:hypothetical protein